MNRTYSPSHTPLSPAQAHYLSTHRPFYYNTRAQLLDWCPDPILSLAVPILAYWSCSIFFHLLDVSGWKWLDKYRIHESPEIVARNLASRAEVLRSVLLQQVMQTLAGFLWMEEQASGELVNHAGHMLRLQPALNGVLAWALGAKLGARTMDRDGARLLYAIYWWAIPTVRLLWCMCVVQCPRKRLANSPLPALAQVPHGHLAVLPPPRDAHEPLALQAFPLGAPPA